MHMLNNKNNIRKAGIWEDILIFKYSEKRGKSALLSVKGTYVYDYT